MKVRTTPNPFMLSPLSPKNSLNNSNPKETSLPYTIHKASNTKHKSNDMHTCPL
jgi:hypothetical protein